MKRLYVILCIVFLMVLFSFGVVKWKKSVSIIRQFTISNSGVPYLTYYLFFTQDEIKDFYNSKIGKSITIPLESLPKISNNEICLFVFTGEDGRPVFPPEIIEKEDKVFIRVDFTPTQTTIISIC